MELVSLKEAKLQGHTRYFTGKPCKHGHVSERHVSGRGCVECSRAHSLRYKATNASKVKKYLTTYKKQYYLEHQNYFIEKSRKWNRENKERARIRSLKYRLENKEKLREQQRIYQKQNPDILRVNSTNHKIRKLKALPKWANMEKIKEIYKNCPIGFQVDHIFPLQGKLICGLHVENNLQYLPSKENASKGNKFDPYTEIK